MVNTDILILSHNYLSYIVKKNLYKKEFRKKSVQIRMKKGKYGFLKHKSGSTALCSVCISLGTFLVA